MCRLRCVFQILVRYTPRYTITRSLIYTPLIIRLSTGHKASELAEQRILSRLSTFRTPHEADTTTPHSANARVSQVQLHDKGKFINMLSIEPTTPAVTNQDDKANQPPTTVVVS